MHTIFSGWRRKMGCVTLVIACVLCGMWVRSLVKIDRFHFQSGRFSHYLAASYRANLTWLHVVPAGESKWSPDADKSAVQFFPEYAESHAEYSVNQIWENEDPFDWKYRCCGIEGGERTAETSLGGLHITIWRFPYWSITVPLTLLSAYLILWKPRKSAQPASRVK